MMAMGAQGKADAAARPAGELGWVTAAGLLGFGVTATTAGKAHLARPWVVLAHATATGTLAAVYARRTELDVGRLVRTRWKRGVLGGAAVSAVAIRNVRHQPRSLRPRGARLVGELAWSGLVYGTADALLLNVLPVLAMRRALPNANGLTAGAAGMTASAAVTAAYHLGYPEFRGPRMVHALIGDVISAGYAATGNPLAAVAAHATMHAAAVLQGAEGTVQLPPHYGDHAA
jgi:hypothetical protein